MGEENINHMGLKQIFKRHLDVGRIDASHQSEPQSCMPADCVHVKSWYLLCWIFQDSYIYFGLV